MPRSLVVTGAAAAGLFLGTTTFGTAMLLWAAPARAQSDPAALQLIERLRPPGDAPQTRGIRVPGAPAAAPQGIAPAPSPAGDAPSVPPAGWKNEPASAPVVAAPARPPAPQWTDTTAPAGVPAVSITVTFATGSARLTPAAEAALAPLGRALNSPDLAPYRFRIEGHTDTVGSAAVNQELSERRARAVRDYLIQRFNVDPARLEAVGLGQSQLLVPTGDNVPEARNRRVQVLNLGN
jgi:outer membrane protein OmpA-like peptidoglycan-associated protein